MNTSNFATSWTADNPPYAILKWNVRQLPSAQSAIKSPVFEVSAASKWNLHLDPNISVDGDAFIGICLRRSASSDRERLWLKGELSVHDPDNELLFDKTFEKINGMDDGVEFRIPKEIFRNRPSGHNTYLVRCEIVTSQEITATSDIRPHLEKLSSDLKWLFDSGKFADLPIRVGENVISAHKFLLSARFPHFQRRLIETATDPIENSERNRCLNAILVFVYTGDPDLLLASVPLEMFGRIKIVATKWELNELVNLLTPLKMHCETEIKNELFQYTWEIKNLTKLFADNRVLHSSEFFTKEDSNSKWKLLLEKNVRAGDEVYGLYLVKVNSDNTRQKTNISLRVYNNKTKSCVRKTCDKSFLPHGDQKCGFSNLFNRRFVQSVSERDDSLKIVCSLKIHMKSDSWIHFKATSIDISDEDRYSLKYLKTLSGNLRDLCISQKFWDLMILTADNQTIRAHKAILWARSKYFANVLSQHCENLSVPVDADSLKEILLYIYSSVLPILSLSNMQKLYSASSLFELKELWLVCRSFIMLHMTVDNVLDIIELAYKYCDVELEEAGVIFASAPVNAKLIINTQRWQRFCMTHSKHAMRIYHNLAWAYCSRF